MPSEVPTEQWTDTCHHCGNRVPLKLVTHCVGKELFEIIDGVEYREDFAYVLYQCPTCEGMSIFGDFAKFPSSETLRRLYPEGSELLPPIHRIADVDCVPSSLLKQYEDILPLRHRTPNAFAAGIRRALEFVCRDKKANGKRLSDQLQDLVSRNVLPGHFEAITNLMRRAGNEGAHFSEDPVDYFDADLLNDLFRLVVDYVYITPAKIVRLKQRLGTSSRP